MKKALDDTTKSAAALTAELGAVSKAALDIHKSFANPSPGVTRVARQSGNGVDVGSRIVRTPVRITAGGGRSNVSSFGFGPGGGGGATIVSEASPASSVRFGAQGVAPPPATGGGTVGGDPISGKLLAVQQQQLLILQRIDAKLDGGGARDRLEGLV